MVEERKQWKCGDVGRGEGSNGTVDENGGLGLARLCFFFFSLQNHHQRISIVFRVPQQRFLFSLYYHISICFISSSPSAHFYCFPSSTTTTTTFQIVLRHHIMTPHRQHRNVEKKFKLKEGSEDQTIRVI